MHHKRYPKIQRLGKEETDGILDREVFVQEKIDGANLSIWTNDDDHFFVGSRSQDVTNKPDAFNGAVKYAQDHPGINRLLFNNPSFRLFGEWLVPHTIRNYKPSAYGNFYLYDIYIDKKDRFLPLSEVEKYARENEILFPKIFLQGIVTEEEIKEVVGKTDIGERGEGVVIKPVEPFTNQFGDTNIYAKVVTEEFKENNGIIFGGNNKHSDTYVETWISNKYMTATRVQKMMNKLSSQGVKLDKSCTSRFVSQVYHDLITEEAWEIANSGKTVNFQALGRICKKKAQLMFHDFLEGNTSVAYANNTEA